MDFSVSSLSEPLYWSIVNFALDPYSFALDVVFDRWTITQLQ